MLLIASTADSAANTCKFTEAYGPAICMTVSKLDLLHRRCHIRTLTTALAAWVCEGRQAGHDGGHPYRARGNGEVPLALLRCLEKLLLRAIMGNVGEVGGRQSVDLLTRDGVCPLLQQLVALHIDILIQHCKL